MVYLGIAVLVIVITCGIQITWYMEVTEELNSGRQAMRYNKELNDEIDVLKNELKVLGDDLKLLHKSREIVAHKLNASLDLLKSLANTKVYTISHRGANGRFTGKVDLSKLI